MNTHVTFEDAAPESCARDDVDEGEDHRGEQQQREDERHRESMSRRWHASARPATLEDVPDLKNARVAATSTSTTS
jgi:hypothetical protein